MSLLCVVSTLTTFLYDFWKYYAYTMSVYIGQHNCLPVNVWCCCCYVVQRHIQDQATFTVLSQRHVCKVSKWLQFTAEMCVEWHGFRRLPCKFLFSSRLLLCHTSVCKKSPPCFMQTLSQLLENNKCRHFLYQKPVLCNSWSSSGRCPLWCHFWLNGWQHDLNQLASPVTTKFSSVNKITVAAICCRNLWQAKACKQVIVMCSTAWHLCFALVPCAVKLRQKFSRSCLWLLVVLVSALSA